MSREIKFRAWSKGKMLPLGLLNQMTVSEFLNKELMQYSGLRDRNGVEIYEGDIYHHKTSGNIGVIRFAEGAFYCDHNGLRGYSLPNINDGEVIGNIHENPDLLA